MTSWTDLLTYITFSTPYGGWCYNDLSFIYVEDTEPLQYLQVHRDCLMYNIFIIIFCFEVLVDSHAVVRNNTERSCVYPVSSSGNILHNCMYRT